MQGSSFTSRLSRRRSSKNANPGPIPKKRPSLLDLESFRAIFPSHEAQGRQSKRRQEVIDRFMGEASLSTKIAKRPRRSSVNIPLQGTKATITDPNISSSSSLATTLPPMDDQQTADGSHTTPMALILSNVTMRDTDSFTSSSLQDHGLHLKPLPRQNRAVPLDIESMEAAYLDVRLAANQLEDQLTRAFEARDTTGQGGVSLTSIRDILRENEFQCSEEELAVIMQKMVQQQSTAGEVVDFRRFLTAMRPRVWTELMTQRLGTYDNHTTFTRHQALAAIPNAAALLPNLANARPKEGFPQGHHHHHLADQHHHRPAAHPLPAGSHELPGLLPSLNLEETMHSKGEVRVKGWPKEHWARDTPHVLQRHEKGPTILELKKELALAEYGVKVLQRRVKQNVEWVNEVCGARTSRAKKLCRAWGGEKMAEALTKVHLSRLRRFFTRWLDFTHFLADQELARNYLRFKACHLLTSVLSRVVAREYRKGMDKLHAEMEKQRYRERQDAAVTIQKHARGSRQCRERRSTAATKIQTAARGRLARRLSSELKTKKKRERSASIIQKRFKGYHKTLTFKRQRSASIIQRRFKQYYSNKSAKEALADVEEILAKHDGTANTTSISGTTETPSALPQDKAPSPPSSATDRDQVSAGQDAVPSQPPEAADNACPQVASKATTSKRGSTRVSGNDASSIKSGTKGKKIVATAMPAPPSEEELKKREENRQKRIQADKEKRQKREEEARVRILQRQKSEEGAKKRIKPELSRSLQEKDKERTGSNKSLNDRNAEQAVAPNSTTTTSSEIKAPAPEPEAVALVKEVEDATAVPTAAANPPPSSSGALLDTSGDNNVATTEEKTAPPVHPAANEEEEEKEKAKALAATKIQSIGRGRVARKKVHDTREQKSKKAAVTTTNKTPGPVQSPPPPAPVEQQEDEPLPCPTQTAPPPTPPAPLQPLEEPELPASLSPALQRGSQPPSQQQPDVQLEVQMPSDPTPRPPPIAVESASAPLLDNGPVTATSASSTEGEKHPFLDFFASPRNREAAAPSITTPQSTGGFLNKLFSPKASSAPSSRPATAPVANTSPSPDPTTRRSTLGAAMNHIFSYFSPKPSPSKTDNADGNSNKAPSPPRSTVDTVPILPTPDPIPSATTQPATDTTSITITAPGPAEPESLAVSGLPEQASAPPEPSTTTTTTTSVSPARPSSGSGQRPSPPPSRPPSAPGKKAAAAVQSNLSTIDEDKAKVLAATKIQSLGRGGVARKKTKQLQTDGATTTTTTAKASVPPTAPTKAAAAGPVVSTRPPSAGNEKVKPPSTPSKASATPRLKLANDDEEKAKALAASKIQALGRGRVARKKLNQEKGIPSDDTTTTTTTPSATTQSPSAPSEAVTSGVSTKLAQPVQDEEEKAKALAASKIQALGRGRGARKRLQEEKGSKTATTTMPSCASISATTESTITASSVPTIARAAGRTISTDPVNEDEEKAKALAASKIQALGRGRVTRKKLQEGNIQGSTTTGTTTTLKPEPESMVKSPSNRSKAAITAAPIPELKPANVEEEKAKALAASKIQALGRGRVARKKLQQEERSTAATTTTTTTTTATRSIIDAEKPPSSLSRAAAAPAPEGKLAVSEEEEKAKALAASRIQALERGRMTRKKLQEEKGVPESPTLGPASTEHKLEVGQQTKVPSTSIKQAVQPASSGSTMATHSVPIKRPSVSSPKAITRPTSTIVIDGDDEKARALAASKIQALGRGNVTRKRLQEDKNIQRDGTPTAKTASEVLQASPLQPSKLGGPSSTPHPTSPVARPTPVQTVISSSTSSRPGTSEAARDTASTSTRTSSIGTKPTAAPVGLPSTSSITSSGLASPNAVTGRRLSSTSASSDSTRVPSTATATTSSTIRTPTPPSTAPADTKRGSVTSPRTSAPPSRPPSTDTNTGPGIPVESTAFPSMASPPSSPHETLIPPAVEASYPQDDSQDDAITIPPTTPPLQSTTTTTRPGTTGGDAQPPSSPTSSRHGSLRSSLNPSSIFKAFTERPGTAGKEAAALDEDGRPSSKSSKRAFNFGSNIFTSVGFGTSKTKEEEEQAALRAEERAIKEEEIKRKKQMKKEEEQRRKDEEKEAARRRKEEEKERREEEAREKAKLRQIRDEEERKERERKEEEEKAAKKEKKRQDKIKRKQEEEERAKEEEEKKKQQDLLKAKQIRAALRVQRIFRGFRARKRTKTRRKHQRELEAKVAAIILRATIRIQKTIRGKIGRKRFALIVDDLRVRRDKLRVQRQKDEEEKERLKKEEERALKKKQDEEKIRLKKEEQAALKREADALLAVVEQPDGGDSKDNNRRSSGPSACSPPNKRHQPPPPSGPVSPNRRPSTVPCPPTNGNQNNHRGSVAGFEASPPEEKDIRRPSTVPVGQDLEKVKAAHRNSSVAMTSIKVRPLSREGSHRMSVVIPAVGADLEEVRSRRPSTEGRNRRPGSGPVSGSELETKLKELSELEKRLKEREASLVAAEERLKMTATSSSIASSTSTASSTSNAGPIGGESGNANELVKYAAPTEWIEYWDAENNCYYYYNTVTQQSSWDPPGGSGTGSDSSSVATENYEYACTVANNNNDGGGSEWVEMFDEANQCTYWYNNFTGEACWTDPNTSKALAPYEKNREQWVSYIDENTGAEYWYNVQTGESSWG